jgi:O-antigen biosynthesis protein
MKARKTRELPQNISLTPRNDVLNLLPPSYWVGKTVLDVGCGNGATGEEIKKKGAKKVVGIELSKTLVKEAEKRMDEVLLCDLDEKTLLFKEKSFDVIICADVIEHLKDPEEFLIRCKQYLKKEGKILICIPNVQYYYVLYCLLRGVWEYKERGIFDKTHLRFFTRKSIHALLEKVGLKVLKMERNYRLREPYCMHENLAKYLSMYIFRDFLTFQYRIVVTTERKEENGEKRREES